MKPLLSIEHPVLNRTAVVLAVLVILLVSFYIRIEEYWEWEKQPKIYFFNDAPIINNFDGYHYLDISRDLLEEPSGNPDPAPAGALRNRQPFPPPLISVIAATVTKVTGLPLRQVAIYLPAVLGLLLAVPLYGLGYLLGGRIMAVGSLAIGLTTPLYALRSGIAWFDTDCLNVTLSLAVVLSFFAFAFRRDDRFRGLYLVAGGLCSLLLFWSWRLEAHTLFIVILPLVTMLFFYYRFDNPNRKVFWGGVCTVIALAIVIGGSVFWTGIFKQFDTLLSYFVAKKSAGDFPNVATSVTELEAAPVTYIAQLAIGGIFGLVSGFCGVVLLLWKKPKESAFLLVLLAIGLLSFTSGPRYTIFLGIVLSLGVAFLARILISSNKKKPLGVIVGVSLILFIAINSSYITIVRSRMPVESAGEISGMALAGTLTPKDAVIWAWWDQGYALRYWSERDIINHNGSFNSPVTVYNAIPLATKSDRLSANFMQFYVTQGRAGIDRAWRALGADRAEGMKRLFYLLAAGPETSKLFLEELSLKTESAPNQSVEEWLSFLFPDESKPIFLFINERLSRSAYWWYWMGSWDFSTKTGKHALYLPFFQTRHKNGTFVDRATGFVLDSRSGRGDFQQKSIAVKKIILHDGKERQERDFFGRPEDLPIYEAHLPSGMSVILDSLISRSIFHNMYLRRQAKDDYFSIVRDNAPYYQIWKVHGDQYSIE